MRLQLAPRRAAGGVLRVQLPSSTAGPSSAPPADGYDARRGSAKLDAAPVARLRPPWHRLRAPRAGRRAGRRRPLGAGSAAGLLPRPNTAQPAMARQRSAGAPELPGTDEAARTHLALPDERRAHRAVAEVVAAVRDARLGRPHQLARTCSSCGRSSRRCEARGAEVRVTARDFAQTLALCERFGIDARGDRPPPRRPARGQGARAALALAALARWARGRRFDLALGHGSNDVTRRRRGCCGSPARRRSTTSGRRVQHTVNCRLAQAVVVPEAIPPERLAPLRRHAAKLRALPGPQGGVLPRRLRARPGRARRARARPGRADRRRAHAARRLALPPLREPAVRACSSACAGEQAVVLPRTPEQRAELRAGGFIVPDAAIDAQSLIAYADLVDLRRRHDEPRGGRARHAGVDDVRGPPRRGRRAR